MPDAPSWGHRRNPSISEVAACATERPHTVDQERRDVDTEHDSTECRHDVDGAVAREEPRDRLEHPLDTRGTRVSRRIAHRPPPQDGVQGDGCCRRADGEAVPLQERHVYSQVRWIPGHRVNILYIIFIDMSIYKAVTKYTKRWPRPILMYVLRGYRHYQLLVKSHDDAKSENTLP